MMDPQGSIKTIGGGLFPSFSAGWRISQESFIKDKVEWIDNLKLRASYSNLGYECHR